MNLKLRKVRRMLSAVLAGCLISSMAVSAGDIQNTVQEESTVSDGAGAEEENLTEDGQPAGGLPDGGLSETLDSGSEDGKEEDAAEGRGPAESNQAEQRRMRLPRHCWMSMKSCCARRELRRWAATARSLQSFRHLTRHT